MNDESPSSKPGQVEAMRLGFVLLAADMTCSTFRTLPVEERLALVENARGPDDLGTALEYQAWIATRLREHWSIGETPLRDPR